MQLKLLRLVGATFHSQLTSIPFEWSLPDGILVRLFLPPQYDAGNKNTILVIVAEKILTEPLEIDVEGAIRIPGHMRHEQEKAIEDFVNVHSVIFQCKRSIFSFNPCVAIESLDSEGETWLNSAKCIHVPLPGIPPRMSHDFSCQDAYPHLLDRLDGVSLIAEALCHEHPSGKLHEFIRLFERAFASAARRVCQRLLPQFLVCLNQGYTHDEIAHWLDLRDSSAHADRRQQFALEADTRPVVARMEQAAYDVLFNKLAWRDSSIDRRSVFRAICGSSSGSGSNIFATQGKPFRISCEIIDHFGSYPVNLNFSLHDIPKKWFRETSVHGDITIPK